MQALADFADSLLGGAILIALSLCIGGTVFGLAVVRPWRSAAWDAAARRVATLIGAGALGVALVQLLDLLLKLALLREWDGPAAWDGFVQTLQAQAGGVRMSAALLMAGTAFVLRARPRDPARWLVVAVAAVLLAVSGAWLAHAASRLDGRAPLMAGTVVHQVAAVVWVGGILQLLALHRLARRDPLTQGLWPSLVQGFAGVAIASVGLLVFSGMGLAVPLVGSWQALVGSGYGSLVITKSAMMAVALALGGTTFLLSRTPGAAERLRTPAIAGAEAIVLVCVLFTAAGLAGQPPPSDTPGDRATLGEVLEVFRPKIPSLRTPPMRVMAEDTSDPLKVTGGERTPAAYAWSNFSHNVAGLVLLAMGLAALLARTRLPGPWRHWAGGFVVLAVFVFLRSSANDGIWPFGPIGVWESMRGDAELLQHRLGALLALLLGLLEWRVRVRGAAAGRMATIFPGLCVAGGVLLLTHAHAAFEPKAYYLVQITHTTMGALAVLMGAGRWLELRLDGRAGRLAGFASDTAMVLVALILVFYREANVVLPDSVWTSAGPAA